MYSAAKDCPAMAETADAKGKGRQALLQWTACCAGNPKATLPEGTRTETFVTHRTADGEEIKMWVYLPAAKSATPMPCVLWCHGSGFAASEFIKNPPDQCWLDSLVAKHGYAMAVLQHRPGEKVGWLGVLHDGKAALRCLRGNAVSYLSNS